MQIIELGRGPARANLPDLFGERSNPDRPPEESPFGSYDVVIVRSGERIAEGLTRAEAEEFCSRWNVAYESNERSGLSPRTNTASVVPSVKAGMASGRPASDPTARQIRARCAAIRQEWTPKEERSRRGWSVRSWTPPGSESYGMVLAPAG